jgi:hypothetical protein
VFVVVSWSNISALISYGNSFFKLFSSILSITPIDFLYIPMFIRLSEGEKGTKFFEIFLAGVGLPPIFELTT